MASDGVGPVRQVRLPVSFVALPLTNPKTMLERLKGLFGKVDEAAMTQPQREAMVDLLLWTMYADRVLSLPENERIDQMQSELSWESVTPFAQYLSTSIARVREVLTDEEKADALMDGVYARLDSDAVRRKAYEAARQLAQSDGEIAEEEALFLERVRARFALGESD